MIQSALISVYNKDGLKPLVEYLHQKGVKLISTGGTQKFIEEMNIPVTAVDSLTNFPEIFGGRVKTLHPAIFGGILYRRDNVDDERQKEQFNIPSIDLIIVDLYPFTETVANSASHDEIIEKIDIGGISLIRAAAKNYAHTSIISHRGQYKAFLNLLKQNNGNTTLADRKLLAIEAFQVSSAYDNAIANYLEGKIHYTLRYGENPHQPASFIANANDMFAQLHGKELSYNNLLDMDAGISLMADMNRFNLPAFAIIKHNNACGAAIRNSIEQAFSDALAGDPVSAFGGVFVCNQAVSLYAAEKMDEIFFEILIAPSYDEEALKVLKSKKNRILIEIKNWQFPEIMERSILNGKLLQHRDNIADRLVDARLMTDKSASRDELTDLEFANILVKHTKSNAIVLVKGMQLIGSGTGQTSRVDALKQAIVKAQQFGFKTNGAVMASDAFFPFPDCVEIADKAGIKTVVQPGGSIKDQLSVDYCNNTGMAMYFTGNRHFKH